VSTYPIPPQRIPFLDGRGNITKEWYFFLANVRNNTDDSVVMIEDAGIAPYSELGTTTIDNRYEVGTLPVHEHLFDQIGLSPTVVDIPGNAGTANALAPGNDRDLLYGLDAGKKDLHGVESIGSVTFDNSSHILSLSTITYWYLGESFTGTSVTCDIDSFATLTTNTLYFFFFDSEDGTLKCQTSVFNLKTQVPVALVMWNGYAGAIMAEWHSHTRDIDWHINAHLTIGARYYSGLSLTTPTTSVDNALSISGGSIYDEDLLITISNPQTTMRGWYKASASVYTFADYSLPYTGTSGQPQYLDTDTYTLANVGNSDFVCMWVYASNDIARPIYIIPTHAATAYNTVALARTETPPSLAGLNISPELKLLYRFIYKGDGQFQEMVDYRMSSSLPAGGTSATTAASVTFVPTGSIAAGDVQAAIAELDSEKQATLVSGSNIKTINSTSLLGSGDIVITGSGVSDGDKGDITVSGTGATWTIDNGVVTEAKMSIADNTTGNVSTSAHGFCPKAPNDTAQFLRGDASWATLPSSGLTYSQVLSTVSLRV
jgi:hypothetical protein